MTTIIAIEHDSGVTIGFDSKVSYGWENADLEQPKVFANGEVIFGVCGDVLDANILRYADLPALGTDEWDVDRWVTNKLIPAMTAALKERNASAVSNSKIETGGSTLAVVRGRVYRIASDTAWTRHVDGRYAVGSGYQFALGALAAGASVHQALSVAASLDSGTGHRLRVIQAAELLDERSAA